MKTYEHLTLYLESDRLLFIQMRKDIQAKLKGMPELLSISQVADIFSIHPDTLRNWEKDGTLVPLRAGKRGDRKYRPQDIEAIVDKMGSKLTLPQLESFLWKSADILRGKIDSSDYKKYIFGLLFYKRMSDVWDEEYNTVMKEYNDVTIARADYNHRFQIPKDCRWEKITEQAENIGQKLNDIFDKLANANSPKLDKIFEDLDFANKDRFPNETLQRLINHFSQYNFGNTYISSDLLGDAYEYLIKQFAADAGKKGGEFYTPREVERVIMGILKPHQKDHIYDPTVGSGGFLLEAYDYLKQKSGEKIAKTLYLYGQEQNLATFAIAKINMFLHGLDSADIRRGDTLANPQFLNQQGNLQTFDIVVANPPYSIKDWEYEAFKTKFGRLEGYDAPPDKNADYAFVLHIIKSMNQNGRAGIVLPHGVLFRGGAEGRIREQILKNDLIDAVIALPSKLFYGTTIPAVILILNTNKPENHKGKILIIDAEKDFSEGKNQNSLRTQDIQKIIKTYDTYTDKANYAKVVHLTEIKDKDYILKTKLYISSDIEDQILDISQSKKDLNKSENLYTNALKNNWEVFNDILVDLTNRKGWTKTTLGEIADIKNGKTNSQDAVDNGEYPLFDRSIIIKRSNKYLFDKTAIILPGEGAEFIPRYYSGKFDLHQRAYAISTKNKDVDPLYLFYFIFANRNFFADNAVGSTVKSLRLPIIYSMPISIPPLKEQKDIARLFSTMDSYLKNIKDITQKAETLKKALMQDIMTKK